jgi:hypothetical protein
MTGIIFHFVAILDISHRNHVLGHTGFIQECLHRKFGTVSGYVQNPSRNGPFKNLSKSQKRPALTLQAPNFPSDHLDHRGRF